MISTSIMLHNLTPEDWRTATFLERRDYLNHWRSKGIASFACIDCGFPTTHGQAGCTACNPLTRCKYKNHRDGGRILDVCAKHRIQFVCGPWGHYCLECEPFQKERCLICGAQRYLCSC